MQQIDKQRVSLSIFFFISGISFSSWTSRIPTLKAALHLNEAELGSILLTMPLASLVGLPLSGWLVSRLETRVPLTLAYIFNAFCLASIGFAYNTFSLISSLFLYALSMRIFNISVNTQAITLQKQY
ncbi:MAG: MFS transporter, partial [Adhaeribacter sp.]